jgi:hypothetical protein
MLVDAIVDRFNPQAMPDRAPRLVDLRRNQSPGHNKVTDYLVSVWRCYAAHGEPRHRESSTDMGLTLSIRGRVSTYSGDSRATRHGRVTPVTFRDTHMSRELEPGAPTMDQEVVWCAF